MARNSAVNLAIQNNADGFQVGGGTTARTLTVTTTNVTLNQSLQTTEDVTFNQLTLTVGVTNADLVINSDKTDAPSEDMSITFERGTGTNYKILLDDPAGTLKGGLAGSEVAFLFEGGAGTQSWSIITTDTAAAVNKGYITNDASDVCVVTLPTTSAVGSVLSIAGMHANGWELAQGAGQQVHYGILSTTAGATGKIASTKQYDTISLVCIVADTTWVVVSSVGNLDVT